ncbi:MAG: hypothetical protein ACTSVZ_08415 [Promethearchaeota archaeon]
MKHNFSLANGLVVDLREISYSDQWGNHIKYEIEILNRDCSPHQNLTLVCSKRLWMKYGIKIKDVIGVEGHLGSDGKIGNIKGLRYLLRNFHQSSFGIYAWMKNRCKVCNSIQWEVRGSENKTMKCLNCGGEILNP